MQIGTSPVLALVGAQYGSEGKGVIAAHLAPQFDVHVRTGGPNAGHTFMYEGRKYVARQLPVGWINPDAVLVIGAGAVIDPQLLEMEVQEVEAAGYEVRTRLYIDEHAHIIDHVRHAGLEGGVDGTAHSKIGSTGEGVGACRMARINRRSILPDDVAWAKAHTAAEVFGDQSTDTVLLIHKRISAGQRVLLEGTQGSGLSITHGPWPYTTSHDTNAATLAADAGVPPNLVQTLLVARTLPIRVAGNSGPLKHELTWEQVGVEPERTTVTQKQRRIGVWDHELVQRAIMLNDPIGLALTFLDYWFPEDSQIEGWMGLSVEARQRIQDMERQLGLHVNLVSTGPAGTPILENPGYDRVPGGVAA